MARKFSISLLRKAMALFLFTGLLTSCGSDKLYDTIIDLEGAQWNDKKELVYEFDIPDASKTYVLKYKIRYTSDYPNYNLYVTRYLFDSHNREIHKKLQGMDLFHPKTGVPFGGGIGGTYDYEVIADPKMKFASAGKYQIKVKQYMRVENLPGISAFGITLEPTPDQAVK